jgi:hypothetical protein
MTTDSLDPFFVQKLQDELEKEVNATVKLIMLELERFAALPPEIANEPVAFNRARRDVIRKVWTLAKECIRYGAVSVQRDEPRQ